MTYASDALSEVAEALIAHSAAMKNRAKATVVTLSGNLGAGKTTLVQAVGVVLGVSEVITSPTFVVMKRYETTDDTFTTLIHIDAYRIESVTELTILGWERWLAEPDVLLCVEWPEKISTLIPPTAVQVILTVVDEVTRKITYD